MKNLLAYGLIFLCLTAMAEESSTVRVDNATDFSYHVRYKLCGPDRHSMILCWPDEADSAYYKAIIEITTSTFDDPLFPSSGYYSIIKSHKGNTSIFTNGDFEYQPGREPAFSMVLRRTASGTAFSIGADKASATIAVPFSGDSISATAAEGAEMQRHSLIIRSIDKNTKAPFESVKALNNYLQASSDPMESVWEYLDRDINPTEARLGGKYTLATVLTSDGYDIIYLSGAENAPGNWKSLDIKGKLKNTAFDGHYDLIWLAAPRHVADSESSATLDVGGEVLELTFPTLRSHLRFRRVKK